MSLNGTLETFALPDVLALLAATKKTGELKVTGSRGDARLWLDLGQMVGADVPRATTFVDAIFEMLRLTAGTFAFDNDGKPTDPADPVALEGLLLEAQSRLGEWRSIEAVVPSVTCGVELTKDLTGANVSVTREQWRVLVAVAASRDVDAVVTSLELGEFATCRLLKDLVQTGLVAIAEAPAPAPAPKMAKAPESPPEPAPTPVKAKVAPSSIPVPDEAPKDADEAKTVDASALVAAARASAKPAPAAAPRPTAAPTPPLAAKAPKLVGAPAPKPPASPPRPRIAAALPSNGAAAAADGPSEEDDESADLVHQLAQLQGDEPQSSSVRHATAGVTPAPPTETAEPEKDDTDADAEGETKGEEPLNRGLLLKFLNSVRS